MNDASPAFVVISLSWTVFVVYWFIASLKVKRTVERQSRISRSIVTLLVGVGFYLLFSSKGYPILREQVVPHSGISDFFSISANVFGLGVCIWARRTIAGNWSSNVTFKEGHELIESGPYRFVRHPIYTGFLLMVLGGAIAKGQLGGLVAFLLATLGFWYKLGQEEALLTRHFPQAYPFYKSRVKALIPWLL